jgi:hypothetical protein
VCVLCVHAAGTISTISILSESYWGNVNPIGKSTFLDNSYLSVRFLSHQIEAVIDVVSFDH